MKFLKTNYGRALPIPANTEIPIPHPAGLGISSETTATVSTNSLFDDTVTFTTNLIGSTVITETGLIANVVGFVDSNEIVLDADIASASGTTYKLYSQTPHEGFSIYFPKGLIANVDITTIGGDRLMFTDIGDANASMILPVACLTVKTDSSKLIALW